ncbi:RrF2 family transcriptional regulator [Sutcliffiella rhizosphaerae]|uniref:HTH-type transcriptional regulator NsrR n=1 Tax=Sutcliffiella rhizosphaerae TaxID=2880967 RepID=A0ABN8ADK7_9BACI|nr:Rrf2 family transcriptional regulator [Sutcliffiella rhizosphaerae]CAG9622101.1 HTH-type transcriptional repressor NsrR [Sutcliffiella rhizosphaerae]
MRLTNYSDYSLRVLIYLATAEQENLVTIKDIAESYGISKNHLMKVIYHLGKMGYIETIRGRSGGIRLAKPAAEINIGEVIRKTEEDFYIAECFNHQGNQCVISPVCSLKHILRQALEQFLSVLDQYTLQDIVKNRAVLVDKFLSNKE